MLAEGIIQGLAHIGVFSQDIDRAKDFYINTLGFQLTNEEVLEQPNGSTRLAFLKAGSCVIELIQPADVSTIKDRQHGRVDHIAMAVSGIDEIAKALTAQGVAVESEEPSTADICGGAKTIFFKGPDGERLELFEHLA